LSSAGETVYSVEDARPHRVGFDLERVIRTDYLIDAYQQTYFVVESFEELFRNSYDRDFAPLYRAYRDQPGIAPSTLLPTDRIVTRGTQLAAGPSGR
jgi:phenylalanine-4-hydroxylase